MSANTRRWSVAASWYSTVPGPAPPASIKAPTSVLRAVITPAKGATTCLNDSSCCNRETLARISSSTARLACASASLWSTSCLATASVFANSTQRAAVSCASSKSAFARSSVACAWRRLSSTSGVSISASNCPFFTGVPMSTSQRFR